MNGKELSKSSHEETVEAFRSAKDPVVVQVIRRTPSGRPHGPPQEIHVVDVCTQTDITFEHIMALAKLRPSTPPVPDVCPFLLSDRYEPRETDVLVLHLCECLNPLNSFGPCTKSTKLIKLESFFRTPNSCD